MFDTALNYIINKGTNSKTYKLKNFNTFLFSFRKRKTYIIVLGVVNYLLLLLQVP